jgi:uncharacterized protein (TIGR03086 family)
MDQPHPVALLAAAVEAARPTLERVCPDHVAVPTPCSDWTLHALLQHLAGRTILSTRAAQGIAVTAFPESEGDLLGTDPGAVLIVLLEQSVASWRRPEADLAALCTTPLGDIPGFGIVTFHAQDVFVHAWDIGRAIGHVAHFDPELVRTMLAVHQATVTDAVRAAFYGPAIPIAPTAPDLDRLVAFLGRQP